jgi:hypothetical protein
VPDRSRRPRTISDSSGVGGGIELDTPPASSLMAGTGAAGTSLAVADGVLNGVAVVEAEVAVGVDAAAGDGPPAPLPADYYCWEPDPPAGVVPDGVGVPLGAEGEEALASKDGIRPADIIITLTKTRMELHLLWALDLPVALEAGRPLLLLLLLLLLAPLGEITPRWWWWDRWWWWWRWRRTDAPLRALGLGAGPLGPDSGPLALLGRVQINGRVHYKQPVRAAQPASPLFLQPPGATRGGGAARSPFALIQGARDRWGTLEPTPAG